ncbi:dTDP-4-dehydrorhamnose reductase [Brevundimonas basaltis]|uniref:dTDP-4-dehydrorhamnose reductase n=1 Tax=Brevundimonas basaltis TaxID=472166 RepID=A0A7W8MHV7_9CAUL|nr:dTDP-4-dehydrorhamnose reductase [Brevundimonas basaltis]
MIPKPRHLLLTGADGQIGLALREAAWGPDYILHALTREELDISDSGAVATVLASKPFAGVINAAAYTAVDKAETDVSASFLANTLAPARLAEIAHDAGVPMVHFSTDYVFDGRLDRPYREADTPNPLSIYGLSKLSGERAVLMAHPRSVVLRTAWVVSRHRSNFVKTMLRLAKDQDVVRVVADQYGSPTSASDIAEAVVKVMSRLDEDAAAPTGVYHLVNRGYTNWAGLAREIFTASSASNGPSAVVEEITTADYPTPAARPKNSRMETDKIADGFGIRLRPWQEAIGDIVADVNGGRGW